MTIDEFIAEYYALGIYFFAEPAFHAAVFDEIEANYIDGFGSTFDIQATLCSTQKDTQLLLSDATMSAYFAKYETKH